jgi:hypothetical protein
VREFGPIKLQQKVTCGQGSNSSSKRMPNDVEFTRRLIFGKKGLQMLLHVG